MSRQRSNFASVLVLSALLHVIVLGASLVHWPWLRTVIPVKVTPVTLLTTAQIAKLVAASQSDTPQSAQAETPVPDAPPDAPTPEPTPAPPDPPSAPKPAPTPKVAPAPREPAPKPEPKVKPAPATKPTEKAPPPKPEPQTEPKTEPRTPAARPTPGFDLNALAQSIQRDRPQRPPPGPPQSSAPKGPTREELDLQQRAAEGAAKAAIGDFRAGIADQLSRAWRPNCGVEGVSALRIRVRLTIGRDGGLIEAKLVDYGDENAIADPVVRAAATRAMTAARTSAPYRNLPPVTAYDQWKSFIVAFDGKNVC